MNWQIESFKNNFGEPTLTQAKVGNWFCEFQRGRGSFEDHPCSGWLQTALPP